MKTYLSILLLSLFFSSNLLSMTVDEFSEFIETSAQTIPHQHPQNILILADYIREMSLKLNLHGGEEQIENSFNQFFEKVLERTKYKNIEILESLAQNPLLHSIQIRKMVTKINDKILSSTIILPLLAIHPHADSSVLEQIIYHAENLNRLPSKKNPNSKFILHLLLQSITINQNTNEEEKKLIKTIFAKILEDDAILKEELNPSEDHSSYDLTPRQFIQHLYDGKKIL